jgi:hypothetical protein
VTPDPPNRSSESDLDSGESSNAHGRLRRRLTSIPSRLHRQVRFWSRSYPRQNEYVADPAVAIPVFAMQQITRLDYAMCVNHADAIGEDNLGFHAVDMGNVAVELRPVAVVPSRPVFGINERQSVVGGTTGNRNLPLPLEVVSLLRAKFARRAEKHCAEEKRSGQTPSHGDESITGVSQSRPSHRRGSAPDARPPQPKGVVKAGYQPSDDLTYCS